MKNNHLIRYSVRLLAFAIGMWATMILPSCTNDIIYSEFYPVSSEKWHADSIFQTELAVTDTTTSYQIRLYLRHTERYPYQNIWLFVSDDIHTDTLEYYLADDRGHWLGDTHNGFIEMSMLYEDNHRFQNTGVYHFSIQHAMRDTLLRGITDVGFEVVKNR